MPNYVKVKEAIKNKRLVDNNIDSLITNHHYMPTTVVDFDKCRFLPEKNPGPALSGKREWVYTLQKSSIKYIRNPQRHDTVSGSTSYCNEM